MTLFDRTTIAVSERSLQEIADISLHVIRDHLRPLLLTLGLLIVPLMVVNHILLSWMAGIDYADNSLLRYVWHMILLVTSEAQIATLLATCYLGQALFDQPTTLSGMFKQTFQSLGRTLWSHGIVRASLLILGAYLLLFLVREGDLAGFIEFLLIPALVFYSLIVRVFRPFVTELLILEKCPLRSSDPTIVALAARSKSLHAPAAGDLMGRAIAYSFLAILMSFVFIGSVLTIWDVFAPIRWNNFFLNFVLFPLCLWATIGILFVNRFLGYLDVRTRQEGWEVELQLRAEAVKLNERTGAAHG